jgi:ADP-ribose pyrophosphatase YjhB (NUDIX family)
MNYPMHVVSVGGLIVNVEDKVLLVKSPQRGWEIPGGQVEIGENLKEALIREVKEEAGIDIEVEKLLMITSNIGKGVQTQHSSLNNTIVNTCFSGRAISGELTTSEESLEVGWFSRDEVLDLIGMDFMRDRAKYMLNFDGRVVYLVFSRDPYIVHDVSYI